MWELSAEAQLGGGWRKRLMKRQGWAVPEPLGEGAQRLRRLTLQQDGELHNQPTKQKGLRVRSMMTPRIHRLKLYGIKEQQTEEQGWFQLGKRA